jgi:hypothetical protein
MNDPQAERWFAEKRAEARGLNPNPVYEWTTVGVDIGRAPVGYFIQRRPIGVPQCDWYRDGQAGTRAEADEAVRLRQRGDWDKFGGESHEYRIIEQED